MTDDNASTYHLLRRLQEQNESDAPVDIAQKAARTFTLQPENQPEPGQGYVNVSVYPQDPFVSEPAIRQMTASYINPGLVNARFQLRDLLAAAAQPDEQGNYLFWPGQPQFDQVNSFYYATFTLRMYERYAGRVLPWSFQKPHLLIDPHAGVGGNAYYSELDELLGFNGFQDGTDLIQSSQSADIVSHETAHAILDGMRDFYNESFGLGSNAFHESFGDMTAVLVALHDDSLTKRLLEWTKGDLRIDNFIASLAEQVTNRLQYRGEPLSGRTVYLRNALNKFTDISFDQLPPSSREPELELSREKHNYSRLFTGAFYDILAAIYEQHRHVPADRIAIHASRDVVGHLLTMAIELGPVCELTFADMARAFLAADHLLHGGKYTEILIEVFDRRLILPTAAARDFCASLLALPNLRAPVEINSPNAATVYFVDQVMPALNLSADETFTPLAAYRNANGQVFMTYASTRRVNLIGDQYLSYNGSHIDVFGGLSLAFDAMGRLRSLCLRPVNDEDVRQIEILTADLIQRGQVAPLSAETVLNVSPTPAAFDVSQNFDLDLLLKNPIMIDKLPAYVSDFLGYLMAWVSRHIKR
ncbi:MAG: hypothetical protein LCI00_00780 [Chloroflexi bacterium]|nr:hypothetical protein [Chloroflexota bacterium]MCC6896965.1 hypothetical protein [Anaerolineae bacterium]